MIQRQLFDTDSVHKLHRVSDPPTSREAAKAAAASGRLRGNKALLLNAVRRRPGYTSAEYAHITGLERHEAARRLADLKNDGLVRQGLPRLCSVCMRGIFGRICVTWEV